MFKKVRNFILFAMVFSMLIACGKSATDADAVTGVQESQDTVSVPQEQDVVVEPVEVTPTTVDASVAE